MSDRYTDSFVSEVLDGEGPKYAVVNGWWTANGLATDELAQAFDDLQNAYDDLEWAIQNLTDVCYDYRNDNES